MHWSIVVTVSYLREETKEPQVGITTKKSENFSEWYTEVVLKSRLADYSPVSGFMVIRPRGYAIWEEIRAFFDQEIKKRGVENAYFPLLIPESLLKKEMEHFEGFVPEVAWVTMWGNRELGERLAIRPTSETIMYHTYSKWVSSYKDLPLRINLWNSVVRMEFGDPKLLLRTREFLWQEGHSCFATKQEAEEEVMDILDLYATVVQDLLAMPVLTGRKSRLEKFAGGEYTVTTESIMPDLRVLQMGTSHHLGQNFSRVFDIMFTDRDGERRYVYQNSWGISTRLLGAMVMVHGDDRGLVVPPKVADPKVVIIPIFYSEEEKTRVDQECRAILDELEGHGIPTVYDDRDERTPGWKFNEWELKGVPVRLEVGPRDIEKGEAVLVRRDTYEKSAVGRDALAASVEERLDAIQANLFERAKAFQQDHTTQVADFKEFQKVLQNPGGFVRA
ncbi:MAG: proline--tRNA ligase, partial [Candidatus Geothermarchaeales archaeon]